MLLGLYLISLLFTICRAITDVELEADVQLGNSIYFVIVPKLLIAGQNFVIQIDISGTPAPPSFYDLQLTCQNKLNQVESQTWSNNLFGTPVTLSLSDPSIKNGPYVCVFSASSYGTVYPTTSDAVVIVELTPEQIRQFEMANGLSSGSIWLPLTKNYQ